jgi:hypothetical protein
MAHVSISDKMSALGFAGVLVLFSSSVSAFDFNGAWVTDESKCAKVFVKKNNKLTMSKHSEFFGGGFLVDGNQIKGPSAACKISNRKQDGDVLHLVASCTTQIAVLSPMQFDIKVEDDDKITRLFPDFPDIAIIYRRCPL